MNSLPSIDLNISKRLQNDPEFRQNFFIAESSAKIAQQLINLRKRRTLNQTQLAEKLQTRQPAVSRVESADYLNWSFATLRKFAAALDARIRVIIEASEDVLPEYESLMPVTPDPEYEFVPPLPKPGDAGYWPSPKGRQCGECGMKFEYGVAYGYCCTHSNCPCGWGPLS